jgi:hypothetical protein
MSFPKANSSSLTLRPVGDLPESTSAWMSQPCCGAVGAIRCTLTAWLTQGRPRQLWVMGENSRGSILFPLLVPGGK